MLLCFPCRALFVLSLCTFALLAGAQTRIQMKKGAAHVDFKCATAVRQELSVRPAVYPAWFGGAWLRVHTGLRFGAIGTSAVHAMPSLRATVWTGEVRHPIFS